MRPGLLFLRTTNGSPAWPWRRPRRCARRAQPLLPRGRCTEAKRTGSSAKAAAAVTSAVDGGRASRPSRRGGRPASIPPHFDSGCQPFPMLESTRFADSWEPLSGRLGASKSPVALRTLNFITDTDRRSGSPVLRSCVWPCSAVHYCPGDPFLRSSRDLMTQTAVELDRASFRPARSASPA